MTTGCFDGRGYMPAEDRELTDCQSSTVFTSPAVGQLDAAGGGGVGPQNRSPVRLVQGSSKFRNLSLIPARAVQASTGCGACVATGTGLAIGAGGALTASPTTRSGGGGGGGVGA